MTLSVHRLLLWANHSQMHCVFIVVTMNDCTSTRFGPSSHISDSRRYKLNSIHSWKCAQKNISVGTFMQPQHCLHGQWERCPKRLFVWFRASKNCVQQSLSNYSLLIFSSGWTRFILGVESCPKLPGRGHAFFPSRWSEVISGTESDAMLVWITTERESHKKWDVGLRFWFGVRLDTVITLCWTHADCCNQMLSAI